ncbi:ATP-binding protein [Agromyces aurantiacus]|uniref:histidine kinase n=1 Tax=Agromyces aurantiacus TaxID=165814 RepID=A0ABV9R985_9MICO|nr:sensor histidine kinase [Agromyces aurantiacus]MBM7505244.1 sensor histidine kinase regulating citrate/malate metabolism [Agromyces aurantiacus]
MARWVRGWSIAAKLFALQLAVIIVLAVIAVALIWADARADVERDAAAKSMAIAQTIANDPFVIEGVRSDDPTAVLQPYAVDVMREAGVDFVTIMAPDRTRFTHPDPSQIGRQFLGNIDPALAGEAFSETYTGTLGPSVRSVVPIEDASGEVVALVAAGITVSNTQVALGARIATVIAAAAVMIALGALGAWLLSRYLRRVTWGRGAEEMSRMFAYYEGVLHSIGEGLVLQDDRNRVVLANDRAAELLGLRKPTGRDAAPAALETLGLAPSVADVLARTGAVVDEIVITPTHVLVVDRDVIVSRARPGDARARRVGTVTTLRDHTRLQELTGELATMTTLSDALRSQAHEFANRLHTIIALIELGRPDEAVELASNELALSQALADRLLSAVEEPVLLALLLGKAAQAGERGIRFDVDLPERLAATGIDPRETITIVGNLIDNALDAAAATPSPAVDVSIGMRDGRLVVAVADSGPGPVAGARVFDLGVTSKPDAAGGASHGRGIGLALVRQSVARLGGDLRVEGSRFEVTLPLPAAAASGAAPALPGAADA